MNKVFSAEIKKTLARPAIWILTVLIAIVLVLSALLYKPAERDDFRLSLSGGTVSEINVNFNKLNNDSLTPLTQQLDAYLQNYMTDSQTEINLKALIAAVTSPEITSNGGLFAKYNQDCDIPGISISVLNADKKNVYDKLVEMRIYLYTQLDLANNSIYYALTSTEDYRNIKIMLDEIERLFSSATTTNTTEDHKNVRSLFISRDYKNKLNDIPGKIIFPEISVSTREYLENKQTTFHTRTTDYQTQISDLVKEVQKDIDNMDNKTENIIKMRELTDSYYQTINTYNKFLKSAINNECLKDISVKTIEKLKFFEGYSDYTQKENLTKLTYLFDNGKFETEYAQPFVTGTSSNYEKNAYDFSIFAMQIISVLLIVYCLAIASTSIAGEINGGTMKYLAIRPVTRTSIFFGKLTSNLFMCFILALFSFCASFIVGAVLYSVESMPMLLVINASAVVTMHPLLAFLIFFGCFMLELLVYLIIGMFLSAILKSQTSAIVLSITFYFINILLHFIAPFAQGLKYYPFANLDMFKYFGSGSIQTQSIFAKIFNSPLYNSCSIWQPIIYITASILIFTLIATLTFKKREL